MFNKPKNMLDRPLQAKFFDPLTDALESIRLRSRVHGRLELSAPWGFEVGVCELPAFYFVARGGCVLAVGPDGPEVDLAIGDLAFFPRPAPYILRDARTTRPMPLAEVLAGRAGECGGVLRHGGGGVTAVLVSGCYEFAGPPGHPLPAALPSLIHVRPGEGPEVHWFDATLRLLAAEAASDRPGARAVASRLADILFVYALRAHMAGLGAGATGWLAAVADGPIGLALGLMHGDPARGWTVEELAASVGMSRSAFAARFRELAGEPPLRYLARWRMQRAAELLLGERASVAEAAGAVGYESEFAFARAFKRHTGRTPGDYRRAGEATG